MASLLIIYLPWPHRHLSPNSRTFWRVVAKHKKAARQAGYVLAMEALGRAPRPAPGPLSVSLTFRPPDARARDTDNMLASCKAALDGVADALGVDDSQWTLKLDRDRPLRPTGAVIVTVEAL